MQTTLPQKRSDNFSAAFHKKLLDTPHFKLLEDLGKIQFRFSARQNQGTVSAISSRQSLNLARNTENLDNSALFPNG
jgi:hypothetical protein